MEAAFPTGGTLATSRSGHPEKADCEAELRAFMSDYPGAEVLGTTVTDTTG